ncbi:hypothetical protein GGR21_002393 [Dysgonomonas hofstadii]|uniref:Uncharacterized protein n=1 Tax=Dysgonomonas hofstadii TaxID=637886 RepID=A0A840CN05_9BACT|nr:hypothetical protein [Dysgonomonas hofstadii]MBB4036491.1 hypothetical protein [Dysgonomonas hofstadii]
MEKDLFQEAVKLFKARITDMNKIRELLTQQNPDATSGAIEEAMVRLKAYRKSEGFKFIIIGAILLAGGILAYLMFTGGIIIMALIGALIGGGIGGLAKGIMEYTKN